MTAEEEARRLALSDAIAKANAAIDAIRKITWVVPVCAGIAERAAGQLRSVVAFAQADLEDMKAKALDKTPPEHR